MNFLSPCKDCRHRLLEEVTDGLWFDECEEDAPEGVFGSDWGCFRYEECPEEEYPNCYMK
jgi:hypothetical protein